jgi:UDPglucose 6-dehydrogenase
MNILKCSVIGLGKLGACMAAAIAGRGFEVIGVDKSLSVVKAVNQKRAPVFEPGLETMLKRCGSRIAATTDCEKAVLNSDATFVVVPTPSEVGGGFSLKYVKQAVVKIGRALSKKRSYHIVVITSTVLPQSMDLYIKPILEKQSGKKCGVDFGLCYNPEFIALGTVIHNFLNPDFILIGESDRKAGKSLEDFYRRVCENRPPTARMNFVNAELAKIAVNSFITSKITFANMLAELAQRLPGGDIDVVTQALGFDSRIGSRYLKGGLGYGGPCFPRDNAALGAAAGKLGVKAAIPQATDRFNRDIVPYLFGFIRVRLKPHMTVGVLGLSYKPLTAVIEESQAVILAAKLIKKKIKVVLYDPLALDNVKRLFGARAKYAESARSLIRACDIIVIANPDPKFVGLKRSDFLNLKRPVVIIDCWRILRNLRISDADGVEYIPFGIGRK